MKQQAARDVMKVFAHGEEVSGLIAYGLRNRGHLTPAIFPRDVWDFADEPADFTLIGEAWEILMWWIPIRAWPGSRHLQSALQSTLGRLIDAGSRVAWIGAEGLPFCDPPQLFDPDCMSGSVLAWMTDDGVGDCWIDLIAPISPVEDSILHALRSHAAGLADAK
jgi:hypothetical protein